MSHALANAARALRRVAQRFDADGRALKRQALAAATQAPLSAGALAAYHDTLLFLDAHPADRAQARLVEREFARIASWMQRQPRPLPARLVNQGLPFAPTTSRFSHDCLRWLLEHPQLRVQMARFAAAQLDLNAVLRLTLPALERSETTAGLDNAALLDALRVPPTRRLHFIVEQLAVFDGQPYLKDQLCDALGLQVMLTPTRRAFARAFNRLPMPGLFAHDELLKRFDHAALLDTALPPARALDAAGTDTVVRVLKNTMALTVRETDPATYLDARSLRLYDLERGLSVALFGMLPARQLPLESYIGFTLFKNGLPVAYGGSWLLGPGAQFGMNVFEPFRGGESGYMMCQVLRAYRQAFGIDHFEVDAHQFGLDNPDGIASGAFWFYYRYGFRPLDATLAALAAREKARMARDPAWRSTPHTLLRFTGANLLLSLAPGRMPQLAALTSAVTAWIARAHHGDRAAALEQARERFLRIGGGGADADVARVLDEVAPLAAALSIVDRERLRLLWRMAQAKPVDLTAYQRLMRQFIGTLPAAP